VPQFEDDYVCYEVTTILFVSSFQYIIMAVIFSKGLPYRKPIVSNCMSIALFCVSVCLFAINNE